MSEERWVRIQKVDNNTARVTTNHPSLLKELYNFFAVYAENYRFMPKYKMGIWDGKIYFMQKTGCFPLGLSKYVYKFVKQDGLKIYVDPDLVSNFDASVDFADVAESWLKENDEGLPWVPYQHQIDGALAALKYQRCIIEHATSSGKSLTMALTIKYALIKNMAKKVLVLVPSTGLIKQLSSDFISYGIDEEDIGQFYADRKDINQPIIISTWQSMCKQKELVKEFDMMLCDEAHSLRGNEVRSVCDNAINAKIRIGCTGTMPEAKVDFMRIEGALGPIVHRVTARDLIDAGQASDITIKGVLILHNKKVMNDLKGVTYDIEKEYLEGLDQRNKVITYIAKKHAAVDHNSLILIDHIAHAEALRDILQSDKSIQVFMITGDMPPEKREEIRNLVNKSKKCVIVATYGVFSTGISIKRLHNVIFGSAGKAKIKTLQSIGRGLRLHKEKSRLTLYDIGDNVSYSQRHFLKRMEIYTKSQFLIEPTEVNLDK